MGATFFGDSEQPIFGYYHPARGARARPEGVLLCGPGPQEYMRTHWAFRKLADALARAGFSVFRFDYHGTGDSAGDTGSGNLTIWTGNVRSAAQELRDIAATNKLSVVGFRLGAYLAANAALKWKDLVLWEPLIVGQTYMEQLEAVQMHYLRQNPSPAWNMRTRPEELLGSPLPRAHEVELRALRLDTQTRPQAERVLVMVAENGPRERALVNAWEQQGATELVEVREPAAAGAVDVQAALLSNVMLDAIVTQLTR
jgi:uncharacterized protein